MNKITPNLEAYKEAWIDSQIYGAGFLKVLPDGSVKHINFKEVITTEQIEAAEVLESLND